MTESDDMLNVMRRTVVAQVAGPMPNLSMRQLAILLVTYRSTEEQSVKGLTKMLLVPKPSVSRALGRLCDEGLACRIPSKQDRRVIFVGRTAKGSQFVQQLSEDLGCAASDQAAASAPA